MSGGVDGVSILRVVGATAALILGPIVLAIVLGAVQLAGYKLVRAAPPMFPILVMRGFFVVLLGIAGMVFFLRFGLGEHGWQLTGP